MNKSLSPMALVKTFIVIIFWALISLVFFDFKKDLESDKLLLCVMGFVAVFSPVVLFFFVLKHDYIILALSVLWFVMELGLLMQSMQAFIQISRIAPFVVGYAVLMKIMFFDNIVKKRGGK